MSRGSPGRERNEEHDTGYEYELADIGVASIQAVACIARGAGDVAACGTCSGYVRRARNDRDQTQRETGAASSARQHYSAGIEYCRHRNVESSWSLRDLRHGYERS